MTRVTRENVVQHLCLYSNSEYKESGLIRFLPTGRKSVIETTAARSTAENTSGQPFIRTVNLVKTYRTPAGDFTALKDINLNVGAGEFAAVVGKSGAGKSTLVNMLSGVDAITTGEVWVGAAGLHQLNEDALALWRGRNVGVVYQSFQLMPSLSLMDNILLPMDFCDLYQPDVSEARALELLRMVEMEDQAHKLPSTISGGQQQRAAIARALANDPALIVADEPTGNLDSVTSEIIFALFQKLVQQGKTVLMVTHDLTLAQRTGHVYYLADGQIVDEQKNV